MTVTARVSPMKTLFGVTVMLEFGCETCRTVSVAVLVRNIDELTIAVRVEVPGALLVTVNEACPEAS